MQAVARCRQAHHTQPADRVGDHCRRLWAVAFGRAAHTAVCRGAWSVCVCVCVCDCVCSSRVFVAGVGNRGTIENGRTICAGGSRGDTCGTSSSTQSFRRNGCTGLGVGEMGEKGGKGATRTRKVKRRRWEGRGEDNAEKRGTSQRRPDAAHPATMKHVVRHSRS